MPITDDASPHHRHTPLMSTTADVSAALSALEALASSSATSSSGPLHALLEQHFCVARERILAGSPPKHVIAELQQNVTKAKKQVERGLKTWYAALGNTGKSVEKVSRAPFLVLTSGVPADTRSYLVGVRRPAAVRGARPGGGAGPRRAGLARAARAVGCGARDGG